MNVLAVCQAGTVRSGALVVCAKQRGHDALAAGTAYTQPGTFALLCKWADRIVLAEYSMIAAIPQEFHDKVVDANLGPDRWHNPLHDELLALAMAVIGAL